MAESVDALVSNTSGAIHPGSIPGLGTERGARAARLLFSIFLFRSLTPGGVMRGSDKENVDHHVKYP